MPFKKKYLLTPCISTISLTRFVFKLNFLFLLFFQINFSNAFSDQRFIFDSSKNLHQHQASVAHSSLCTLEHMIENKSLSAKENRRKKKMTEVKRSDVFTKTIRFPRAGDQDDLIVYVHFPAGKKEIVDRVLKLAIKDFPRVHRYFDYIPQGDVHLNFLADAFTANGFAFSFPHNQITLFDIPPFQYSTLNYTTDWLRILVLHEYVHIVTLEMTRGWLDAVRSVFGTLAMAFNTTPRWFAEGLAVWAESEFTGQGRLKHPWIREMSKKFLRKKTNCPDISCLDNPGIYPGGQTAYWVGGYFFKYMEDKKPGIIKCITESNASSLSFFIETAFDQCTGETIEESFSEFRSHFLKKEERVTCPLMTRLNQSRRNSNICNKVTKKFKNIDWYKGWGGEKEQFAFLTPSSTKGISRGDAGERLTIYNAKEDRVAKKIRMGRPIDIIYGPKVNSDQFMVSVFRSKAQTAVRDFYISQKTKKNSVQLKKIERKGIENCHFLFPVRAKYSFCLQYKQSAWQGSWINRKGEMSEPVFKHDVGKNIYNPKFEGQKFVFETTPPFPAFQTLRKKKLASRKKISLTKPDRALFLDSKAEKKKEKKKKIKIAQSTPTYQGWKYLFPKYIGAYYENISNLERFGIYTSGTDPMGNHLFSGSFDYYSGTRDRSPYGGSFSYLYNWSGYTFGPLYFKSLFKSISTEDINANEASSFLVFRLFSLGSFGLGVGVSYGNSNETDFVGRRKLNVASLDTRLSHGDNDDRTMYQGFSLTNNIDHVESDRGIDFIRTYSRLGLSTRLSDDLALSWSGAYGRQFKDNRNFRDGVFFGGGAQGGIVLGAVQAFRFPSYLIPFSDIFGNYMGSSRLKIDWAFDRPYWGIRTTPYFLKNIRLIGGLEFMDSQILFVGDETIRNPSVYSYYYGLVFGADFLFRIPLDIEYVYAESLSYREIEISNTSILLSTSLMF